MVFEGLHILYSPWADFSRLYGLWMLVFFIFRKQVAERESLSTLQLVLIICSHPEHCNIDQVKNKNHFFPELLTNAIKMDVQIRIWTWLAWKSSGGSIMGQRISNARNSLSAEMRKTYVLLLKRKKSIERANNDWIVEAFSVVQDEQQWKSVWDNVRAA